MSSISDLKRPTAPRKLNSKTRWSKGPQTKMLPINAGSVKDLTAMAIAVAIVGFQFGLYHVVAPLSFSRSISLASLFAILSIFGWSDLLQILRLRAAFSFGVLCIISTSLCTSEVAGATRTSLWVRECKTFLQVIGDLHVLHVNCRSNLSGN